MKLSDAFSNVGTSRSLRRASIGSCPFCDCGEVLTRFVPRLVGCQYAMLAYRVSPGPAMLAVLYEIGPLSARERGDAKTAQILVPKEYSVPTLGTFKGINCPLGYALAEQNSFVGICPPCSFR